MHGGANFGLENLLMLVEQSSFSQVSLLNERFVVVGFIRATK
jgi:hypothetical protein